MSCKTKARNISFCIACASIFVEMILPRLRSPKSGDSSLCWPPFLPLVSQLFAHLLGDSLLPWSCGLGEQVCWSQFTVTAVHQQFQGLLKDAAALLFWFLPNVREPLLICESRTGTRLSLLVTCSRLKIFDPSWGKGGTFSALP